MDIAIDFDGTCVTHEFPEIGKDIGAVPVLKKLVDRNHKLILFTMRSDFKPTGKPDHDCIYYRQVIKTWDYLTQAVNWFKENDIPLYGVNENPSQKVWTQSPKAYGEMYIDDAALGCPLKIDLDLSYKPFVDWERVERLLVKQGAL